MSSKRDEWIVNQRLVHNRTFDSIGHDVGLGRERVRQIVKAHERKKAERPSGIGAIRSDSRR